jgi:hypothetical protein
MSNDQATFTIDGRAALDVADVARSSDDEIFSLRDPARLHADLTALATEREAVVKRLIDVDRKSVDRKSVERWQVAVAADQMYRRVRENIGLPASEPLPAFGPTAFGARSPMQQLAERVQHGTKPRSLGAQIGELECMIAAETARLETSRGN